MDKNRIFQSSTIRLPQLGYRNWSSCDKAVFTNDLPGDQQLLSLNKKISSLIRSNRLSEAKKLFDDVCYKNTVTWNSMITGYVKQKRMAEARQLFDQMPNRDVVSWNIMLSGYLSCRKNRWYVEEGKRLFDSMPERDSVSYNAMISAFANMRRMDEAVKIFEHMPERDFVSWNALISGFLDNGDVANGVEYFSRMPTWDCATLCTLVSGLVRNGMFDEAEKLLRESQRKSCGTIDAVPAYNTLIAAYADQCRITEARKIFDQLPSESTNEGATNGWFQRNIVSWNTMIKCYVKVGDLSSARKLFDHMEERDSFSWNTMIRGYVNKLEMGKAERLFNEMPDPDTFTWNLMIAGHAHTGNMDLALKLFNSMPGKNFVSWNSMIAGYEKKGDYLQAIRFFQLMQAKGEQADLHTLSSLLCVAAGLSDLGLGMQLHQYVAKTFIPDPTLNNALITMYSRSGRLATAQKIFNYARIHEDVVTWNAMIGGYASHGRALEALQLFKSMESSGLKPTHITFISVLHACAHAGLLEEGRRIFQAMVGRYGVRPGKEHFASMVDILGRHGHLEEAFSLVKGMPFSPGRAIWSALLSACAMHNDVEIGRLAAQALMRIEPDSSAPYVLLHNLYANNDNWDDAARIRLLMEENNIHKHAAYSTGNSLV